MSTTSYEGKATSSDIQLSKHELIDTKLKSLNIVIYDFQLLIDKIENGDEPRVEAGDVKQGIEKISFFNTINSIPGKLDDNITMLKEHINRLKDLLF